MKTDPENESSVTGDKKIKAIEASLARYCDYQERTIGQVKEKLNQLGAENELSEHIIKKLIDEDLLNEERYAIAYVLGKFRQNKWGKIKIKIGLRGQGVPIEYINSAIKKLEDEEYRKQAVKLIRQKMDQIKGKTSALKKRKVLNYMASKGFENDLVWDIIRNEEIE